MYQHGHSPQDDGPPPPPSAPVPKLVAPVPKLVVLTLTADQRSDLVYLISEAARVGIRIDYRDAIRACIASTAQTVAEGVRFDVREGK